MGCVGSTEPSMKFDIDRAYRLNDRVALRPEPFGALAYHYGNRRLNFLRAHDLVTVIESLAEHETVRSAFDAAGIAGPRRPAFEKALASLAESDFLVAT